MAPRLRRSKASRTEDSVQDQTKTEHKLHIDSTRHRLFILPRSASSSARIVTLDPPSTVTPARYLFCPETGIYELKHISTPASAPSSWLIAENQTPSQHKHNARIDRTLKSPELCIATPMDPLFMLVPLFSGAVKMENMFRLAEDLFDSLSGCCAGFGSLLKCEKFRLALEDRLCAIADIQALGEETTYRLNRKKLLSIFLQKADRMTRQDTWPATLEDAHIRRKLEMPTSVVQHSTQENASAGHEFVKEDAETGAVVSTSSVPEDIMHLQRVHIAFSMLCAMYLPRALKLDMLTMLPADSSREFKPLFEYLAKVEHAKAEMRALRSISDNISRKRQANNDDEAADARAEKKRKKDEADAKAKAETRALKQLKKVDTSGMKKLSSFFTKPPPALKTSNTAP